MKLSIIVVSYNTADLTIQTLQAVTTSLARTPSLTSELIVVDNASTDSSPDRITSFSPGIENCTYMPILSSTNGGFGYGNNLGLKESTGDYILLLNSDVIADDVNFEELISYMDAHEKVGGLTVRVELPNGSIDPASHRGFPTPWRSFTYFTKLQHLTRRIPYLNALFGGYHLVHLDLNTTHEIDSPTAAFFLIRGSLMRELHGFDEDYFMYGEDIDLAMRMKKKGYSILYHPVYTVVHLKHQSGLKTKKKKTQSVTTYHFYNAMKIFFQKHYASRYPTIVTWFIMKAIDIKYTLARLT